MSRETTVKVERGKPPVVIFPRLAVQIDHISPEVIAGSGGAIPHNSFWLFSLDGVPDVRNGDLVTDLKTSEQYRVSGNPEGFDEDHIEAMIVKYVQGTP